MIPTYNQPSVLFIPHAFGRKLRDSKSRLNPTLISHYNVDSHSFPRSPFNANEWPRIYRRAKERKVGGQEKKTLLPPQPEPAIVMPSCFDTESIIVLYLLNFLLICIGYSKWLYFCCHVFTMCNGRASYELCALKNIVVILLIQFDDRMG